MSKKMSGSTPSRCHRGNERHSKAIVDHLHQRMEGRPHHRGMGAKLGPVAGGKGMVLEAMAVFQKQQSSLVDGRNVDHLAPRRFAARIGDVEPVLEQWLAIDLAAIEGQGEQHAVELATVKRLAG